MLGRNLWAGAALFDRIEAVQASATRWLWTYKNERPNMVLDGITPSMKLALAASLDFWCPLKGESTMESLLPSINPITGITA